MRQGLLKLSMEFVGLFLLVLAACPSMGSPCSQAKSKGPNASKLMLHETRSSPLDLEVGGDLAGVPSGTIRYLRREELLALSQASYTVTDDSNFSGPTQVS